MSLGVWKIRKNKKRDGKNRPAPYGMGRNALPEILAEINPELVPVATVTAAVAAVATATVAAVTAAAVATAAIAAVATLTVIV